MRCANGNTNDEQESADQGFNDYICWEGGSLYGNFAWRACGSGISGQEGVFVGGVCAAESSVADEDGCPTNVGSHERMCKENEAENVQR